MHCINERRYIPTKYVSKKHDCADVVTICMLFDGYITKCCVQRFDSSRVNNLVAQLEEQQLRKGRRFDSCSRL